MLSKYQENFASLTAEEAALLSRHIARATGDESFRSDSGEHIFRHAKNIGMTHAAVVLAVAPDPSPEAVVLLEKLVGKPIVRPEQAAPERAAPRAPRTPAPRGNARRGVDPRVIDSVKPNPKKPSSASWARYELYRVGMTVDEFVAAGGTTADVKWDLDKGFITIREEEPSK